MRLVIIFIILFTSTHIYSQDVMLQAWYWDYPKTSEGANWSDSLDVQVENLSSAGFTHLWLPPLSRTSSGNSSNGYDPKDLYDLGEFGLGPTGFSSRTQLDDLISKLELNGIEAVGDVVYNHRDGGAAENNPSVEGWIENMNCTKITNGDQPFPSDRVRFVLPIGGSTGNGAGTYYIKVASASKHPNFYDLPYIFYSETNLTGYQNMAALTENEAGGNGGGDCGQGNETISLGYDMNCTVDNVGSCGGGCGVDEFALTINAGQYNASGDSIYIYLRNTAGYSDHFIYGIWSTSASADVQSNLLYQTYTDFSSMPSGQGSMNYSNFKPNGNPTDLGGDWDSPLFFYDYDQNVASTSQALIDWTQWLWTDVGITGLRMDAVKHFDPAFVGALLDSLHNSGQNPNMVVGEFFDFNAGSLKAWVDNVNNSTTSTTNDSIDVKVFDFALRSALKDACDAFGYDARNLFSSGVVGAASGNRDQVVSFINNHDFRSTDEPIQNDPLLAYAYILTNRNIGTPTVFLPDYAGISIPNAPTQLMSPDINKLIDTYNTWMFDGSYDYISRIGTPYSLNYYSGYESTTVIYQSVNGGINGNDDAIVVINFAGDTLDVEIPMSSFSSKTAGTAFQETTGKGLIPNSTTNASNILRVAVPPRSYGVWVSADTHPNCLADSIIYVDINALGLNNGSNWTNAYKDLAAAISQARFCSEVKQIWIKEGTYTPNIINDRNGSFNIPEGIVIRGGFPNFGNPTISDYDPISNPVILSGDIGVINDNSDNIYSVLKFNSGATSKIVGVQIKLGNANGNLTSQKSGGGVYNEYSAHLIDCLISNCNATTSGNGIFLAASASLILEACTIEDNLGSSTDIFIDSNSILTSKNTILKD